MSEKGKRERKRKEKRERGVSLFSCQPARSTAIPTCRQAARARQGDNNCYIQLQPGARGGW